MWPGDVLSMINVLILISTYGSDLQLPITKMTVFF